MSLRAIQRSAEVESRKSKVGRSGAAPDGAGGLSLLAALVLALQGTGAFACGHCIEDKMAATYDHGVVTRAMQRNHAMVFLEAAGLERAAHGSAPALVAAVEAVPGVDRGTVRISTAPPAVSFSFDPDRYAVAGAVSEINRRLAARKVALTLLRVIDPRPTAATK